MVGAVGTQVTNIQEDVSVHPFLSLPSHPRAALAHVAGFGSGQSSLLQAAVPALLWGAELQVIAESAACLWASGAPPSPAAVGVMADSLASAYCPISGAPSKC